MRSIDLIEIGAGGGSIARVDDLGLLKVGPRSAGADPGPACYGLGGTEPTVTDVDLLLGYLDPDNFLGGRMRLTLEAAEDAVQRAIATPMGLDVVEAAHGVYEVVNESMIAATRIHVAERGADVRRVFLMAFGGAGPVHADAIARALKMPGFIVPLGAGVTSALGFLTAPTSFELARSVVGRLTTERLAELDGIYEELEAEGRALLEQAAVDPAEMRFVRRADLRHAGQGHEIVLDLPFARLADVDLEGDLAPRFYEAHEAVYGHAHRHLTLEIVAVRVSATGAVPHVNVPAATSDPDGDSPTGSRPAYFKALGGFVDVDVTSASGWRRARHSPARSSSRSRTRPRSSARARSSRWTTSATSSWSSRERVARGDRRRGAGGCAARRRLLRPPRRGRDSRGRPAARARRGARRAGGRACYADYEAMLEAGDVDAVCVCVPHDLHLDVARAAVAAGAHLLMEKPIATTLADADEMIRIVDDAGLTMMIGFVHRFRNEVMEAKRLIGEGVLGTPATALDKFCSLGGPHPPAWVWEQERAGGGVLMYGGIHAVDRILWLLDTTAESVYARSHASTAWAGDVEDGLVAVLTLANGVTATLFENSTPYGRPGGWETELFGSDGAVRVRTGAWCELTSLRRTLTVQSGDERHFHREVEEFSPRFASSASRASRPPPDA